MATKRNDPMLAGYMFAYDKTKNPYDYISDQHGMRPGATTKPHGYILHDTRRGLKDVTLPPYAVWNEGQWLIEMDDAEIAAMSTTGKLHLPDQANPFDTWVVSGEGTPGNMLCRVYVLPEEISRTGLNSGNKPKHPANWPKKLKELLGKDEFKSTNNGQGQWFGTGWSDSGSAKATTSKTASSGLPYGLRIRCVNCGHWFKADDIKGHLDCCPEVNGFSDWAIACECCDSLDDTCRVKDGFPRELNIKKEVTADGAGDNPSEGASGDPVDAKGSVDAA